MGDSKKKLLHHHNKKFLMQHSSCSQHPRLRFGSEYWPMHFVSMQILQLSRGKAWGSAKAMQQSLLVWHGWGGKRRSSSTGGRNIIASVVVIVVLGYIQKCSQVSPTNFYGEKIGENGGIHGWKAEDLSCQEQWNNNKKKTLPQLEAEITVIAFVAVVIVVLGYTYAKVFTGTPTKFQSEKMESIVA